MAHAKLSPSAASRWLACTPSVELERQFPDKSSSYADEGTLAHAVGECVLRELAGFISAADAERIMAEHMNNQYYSHELREYAEGYAYFVWAMCKVGTHLFIEQRLDMTDYVEEGFGTGDAIVIGNNILRMTDLKYGKGVPVYAEDNPQLKLYALGAYKEFSHIFNIDIIEINIYQPRLDNISVWEISVKDLLAWAENDLKPKAALAYAGEGEFVPGKHCMFCKAKAVCRALADYNLELAKMEFKNPDLLSDEEVSEILQKRDSFIKWIGAVGDYVLNTALDGKKWEGWKVVEGRANRKYSDEIVVIAKLEAAGHKNIYTEPALLGLGALEKAVTKPVFKQLVEPLLIKPEGKPTLVASSDVRSAYSPQSNGFIIYNDEDN